MNALARNATLALGIAAASLAIARPSEAGVHVRHGVGFRAPHVQVYAPRPFFRPSWVARPPVAYYRRAPAFVETYGPDYVAFGGDRCYRPSARAFWMPGHWSRHGVWVRGYWR